MRLLELRAKGFRNLKTLALEPHPRFNVIWGDNGQGKTNLLEAIYCACALRSFRTAKAKEVIALGEEQAHVKAIVAHGSTESTYELMQGVRSRKIRLNGKAVRPLRNYFGNFNVVLFSPEDLRIPRDSPSSKRKFLDRSVFGAHPDHLAIVQNYEKVVKNRNALLKKGRETGSLSLDLLEVYDGQLVESGNELFNSRVSYLKQLKPMYEEAFSSIISGITASVEYEPSFENLAESLVSSRSKDMARGTTSVGPHRDDLLFSIDGQMASSFASQGQTRAMVLAWKSAEMQLLNQTLGRLPILLLDDVSSELDAEKNEKLFSLIERQSGQCFVSTTNPEYVRINADRKLWNVESGAVTADM